MVGTLNAGAAVPAESGGAGRQAATLEDFSVWFCRRFARVEAAREAKNQIEVKFGQTQAGEHHIQAFNNWLEKLPDQLAVSLAATTHIEHFLASLSPLVPSDLEDSYDPPRKTLTDEHAAAKQGAGFASLTATQDRLLVLERPVARAARNLDLDQHWIDYAGRKLSRADTTKAGRKKLVGAMEMGDTPLTEASSRALMAGYADSAALEGRRAAQERVRRTNRCSGVVSQRAVHTAADCGLQDGLHEGRAAAGCQEGQQGQQRRRQGQDLAAAATAAHSPPSHPTSQVASRTTNLPSKPGCQLVAPASCRALFAAPGLASQCPASASQCHKPVPVSGWLVPASGWLVPASG